MITVIKASGEKEPFSREKLLTSIQRANVPYKLRQEAVNYIDKKLYKNIPTAEIYRYITEFLSKSIQPYAKSRYSLKQAIMDLGPTGYPFEDFISKILQTYEYETQTRVILSGKCISHEIDVVATKQTHKLIVEAKFHNKVGIKTDVHVALYTKARFDDIIEKNDFNQVWLITNTKLSTDAISYAICSNMKITSWNYPQGQSLRELVEQSGLTPITSLSLLTQEQKQFLLDKHIVLCKDICQNPSQLSILRLSEKQTQSILAEAAFVCDAQKDLDPFLSKYFLFSN